VSLSRILQSLHQPEGRTGNEPRALVVWRRLSEIRLFQLLSLEQVGYDTKRSSVTLCRTERDHGQPPHISHSLELGTYGCCQTSSITDRQQVQPLSRPTSPLNTLHDPISTPFSHGPILPEVDFVYRPPRLYHLLSNLLYGRVGINTRIQDSSDLVEGSTQVDRSRSGKEEMLEERFDVIVKLDRGSQEIRAWVLAERSGDVRRHRQSSQGTDGRCPPNLNGPDGRNEISQPRTLICVSRTFMDLIASYAFSMVSTSIHSWVCGSKSWSIISILLPETRIDEMAAIVLIRDRNFPIGENGKRRGSSARVAHRV
jgi:hypothetical protein